jgi:hypothetical protein
VHTLVNAARTPLRPGTGQARTRTPAVEPPPPSTSAAPASNPAIERAFWRPVRRRRMPPAGGPSAVQQLQRGAVSRIIYCGLAVNGSVIETGLRGATSAAHAAATAGRTGLYAPAGFEQQF